MTTIIIALALIGIVLILNYKIDRIWNKLKEMDTESNEDARRIKIRQAHAKNRQKKLINRGK